MPDNRQLIRFTTIDHCVMHIMLLCMLHLKYDNGTFRPQSSILIVIATFTKLDLLPIFEFSLSNLILVFI